VVKLVGVGANTITFDRPLRFDVRLEWSPQIQSFEPTVREVGIENLSLEFTKSESTKSARAYGIQGIRLMNVADSWLRNLTIRNNVGIGIALSSMFCTVSEVVFESEHDGGPQRRYGVLVNSPDNLVTGFEFKVKWFYEIVLSIAYTCGNRSAMGNVFSRGTGLDVCLDHHMHCNYENLFTDLDVGLGEGRGIGPLNSGGSTGDSKNSAARGTLWNIRSAKPIPYPCPAFGPESVNYVALRTDQPTVRSKNPEGTWFEAIAPGRIHPQNLHQAQLALRHSRGQGGRCWWEPVYLVVNAFDHNLIAGESALNATITAYNDADQPQDCVARVSFRDADGRVLCRRELPFGEVEGRGRKALEFRYPIPAALGTGWYRLVMTLLDGSRWLDEQERDVYVAAPRDLAYVATTDQEVAFYGGVKPGSEYPDTKPVLDAMGLEYDAISSFDGLGKYDVLIIGAHSVDDTVVRAGGSIREWIENDGRLLSFEQHRNGFPMYPVKDPQECIPWLSEEKIVAAGPFRYVKMAQPKHPLFRGLEQRMLDCWNGNRGVIFTRVMGPVRKRGVVRPAPAEYFGRRYHAYVLAKSVVSDLAVGKGVMVMSQLELTGRYGSDPVATRAANNLVSHILSGEVQYSVRVPYSGE